MHVNSHTRASHPREIAGEPSSDLASATESRERTVFITNPCSSWNKGDLLIRSSIVQFLLQSEPELHIVLESLDTQRDRQYFPDPRITLACSPLSSARKSMIGRALEIGTKVLFTTAISVLGKRGMPLPRAPPATDPDILSAYMTSDLVLSPGGGFLGDTFPFSCFLPNAFPLLLARRLEVPYVIVGQSIGPVRRALTFSLMKLIMESAELVAVRDAVSYELVSQDFGRARLMLGADCAFVSDVQIPIVAAAGSLTPTIGIAARNWRFPGRGDAAAKRAEYRTALLGLVKRIRTELLMKVVFIPQVIGPRLDDDRLLARYIKSESAQDNGIIVEERDLTPQQLLALISQCDIVLSSRMHTVIAALMLRIPAIGIACETKTTTLMESFGLRDCVVPIDELSADRLFEAVQSTLRQRPGILTKVDLGLPRTRAAATQQLNRALDILRKS